MTEAARAAPWSPASRAKYTPGDLERWRRRLLSRELGEDPDRYTTWVLDDLWRAAAYEQADREWAASVGQRPGP